MKIFEMVKDELGETLKVTEGEKTWWVGSKKSRRYAEYLRYTEWVEAGNNPEDFWTQEEM